MWAVAGVLLVTTMWTTPIHGRPNRWLAAGTALAMTAGIALTLLTLSALEGSR